MKKTIAIAGIAAAASAGLVMVDEAVNAQEKDLVIEEGTSEAQALQMTSQAPYFEEKGQEDKGNSTGEVTEPTKTSDSSTADAGSETGADQLEKVKDTEAGGSVETESAADAAEKKGQPAADAGHAEPLPVNEPGSDRVLLKQPVQTVEKVQNRVETENRIEPDGWNQDQTSYFKDGKFITGIQEIDGKKYYFSDEGQKVSNKFIDLKDLAETTKTVYFDVDGAMVYGQKKIDKDWYCFEFGTGYMFTGLTNLSTAYQPNGAKTVYYNRQGQMEYGEIHENGNWRYFDTYDGHMVTDQEVFVEKSKDNSEQPATYYFGKDGKKIYGEKQTAPGIWKLYKKDNGARVEGFFKLTKKDYGTDKDKTVYYNMDGEMQYGQQKINGNWYCFSLDNGAMMTGLTNLSTRYQKNGAKTVLYGSDGVMCYGEHQVGNDWLYFDTFDGSLTRNKEVTVLDSKSNGGKTSTYYYGSDGRKIHGEKQTAPGIWKLYDLKTGARVEGFYNLTKKEYGTDQDKRVYYNEKGEMQYGQQKIDGNWYCFDLVSGKMMTGLQNLDTRYQPSGAKTVYYGEDGRMVYGVVEIKEPTVTRVFTFDNVTGAKKDGTIRKEEINGRTGLVYYGSRGLKSTGQHHLDGKWYYFDPDNNGFAATGLFHLTKEMEPSGAKTVFYNEDGSMYYGQKEVDKHWRWFKPGSGAMAVNEFIDIPASYNKDGSKRCYYDENGWMKYGTLSKGKVDFTFNNVTGALEKTVVNGVPYLMQTDPRWANRIVAGCRFGELGCVPTSLTMMVNALTGLNVNPYDLGYELYLRGDLVDSGTYARAYGYVAQRYGLKHVALTSVEMLGDWLKKGGMVVSIMGTGNFAQPGCGHAICIFNYDNGKTNVYDPYWPEHNGAYSLNTIFSQTSTNPYSSYKGSPLAGFMKM